MTTETVTTRTRWAAGVLAVAAVAVLGGCSGDTPAASPSPSPSAAVSTAVASGSPSASSSAATPGAASPSAAPSATPTRAAAQLRDPCAVISVARMSKLTGVALGSQKASDVSSTKLCSYAAKTPTSADAATVTTQEGKFGGTLDQVVDILKGQFKGGQVADLTVPGAEAAKILTVSSSGVTEVDVIAAKDGVYYQALIGGSGSLGDYEAAMTKVAAALVAG